jgi:hypothetical protein
LFTSGDQFRVLAPQSEARASLPLSIRWRAPKLPAGDSFALFVDRAPMRPGNTLRSLMDKSCKRTPGCPDESTLEGNNIYITTQTSLQLTSLGKTGIRDRGTGKEIHSLRIVEVNGTGHRVGEGFASVEFVVERNPT